MKKAKRFLLRWCVAVLLALSTIIAFVGCDAFSVRLNATELFLDRYQETQLVASGEENVAWTSDNESVVTVENGLVVAQGTGETVVTARSGMKTTKVRVVVKNSGEKPKLQIADASGFVGKTVTLDTKITYGGAQYHANYVYAPQDTDVAVCENGELKGVRVGQTLVKATCAYKGLTLKKDFMLTVQADSYMKLDGAEYTVACTDNPLKQSQSISAMVVRNCAEVENPQISLQVLEGSDYVATQGNCILGLPNAGITEEKTALIKVTHTQDGEPTLEQTVEVLVKPSFEQKENNEFMYNGKYLSAVEYKPYAEEVGGRTGVYRYFVGENGKGAENALWSAWGTQIELRSTMTESGVYKYVDLLGAGYRFVSYDVYFTGIKGLSVGKYGDAVQAYADSYLFRDDIFIVDDGCITNTLVANKWVTVFVDLEKILSFGKDCNIFLQNINVGEETFVDNVRYWYDGNTLSKCVKEFAFSAEKLTESGAVATAQPNEFKPRSNVYATFEPVWTVAGAQVENAYRYETLYSSDAANEAYKFDAFTRSKLLPYHDYTGWAYSNGYNYIAFDVYVEQGSVSLEIYDGLKKFAESTGSVIAANAAASSANLYVFQGGKRVNTFSLNAWYTVVARIDGRNKESFALTSYTQSIAYIKNVKYFKDESFKAVYAVNEPFETSLRDLVLFVGDELAYAPAVYYLGEPLTEGVSCVSSNESVVEYVNGVLIAKKSGMVYFTVTAQKGGFTLEETFCVEVYPTNALLPNKDDVTVFDGSYAHLKNSEELGAVAIVNGEVEFSPAFKLVYVGDAETYLTIDGNKVIGKKAGSTVVRMKLRCDESIYADVTVTVLGKSVEYGNDEFIVFGNATSTYAAETQAIGGVNGAYKYVTDKSWAGRLELKETSASLKANGDAQQARDNVAALGYEWVLFDLYQTGAMTLFYPTQTGHCNGGKGVKLSAGVWSNDDFLKIYQGEYAVTKIAYNEWYTVAVKLTGWKGTYQTSSVALACYDDTSVCYLTNVRYYVDNSFVNDYQIPETSKFAEVAMTEFSAVNTSYVSFGEETTKFNANLGAYRYQATGTDKYEWDNRIVFATNPKTAVANGYKYIAFDVYVETDNFGASNKGYIYVSGYKADDNTLKPFHLSDKGLGTGFADIFTPSNYVKLYANGQEVNALQTGAWTTVVVALEQLDSMTFYIGCRFGGEFWLKDARLYKAQADYENHYKNIA